MFLPPLSVFTQCIQCAPGIPHANFVEQFVTFAERHLDKSRLDTALYQNGCAVMKGVVNFDTVCTYLPTFR